MATKSEELQRLARGEGCLGKAADDEPIFILRGQDLLAPSPVILWAARARMAGCKRGPDDYDDEERNGGN